MTATQMTENARVTGRNGLTADSVHRVIADWASARPQQVAVRDGGLELTYAELVAEAGALAATLADAGLPPEGRVGIVCERGAGFVVAALAVLAAGGAYVPLDPSYPVEVLERLSAGAGLSFVVAPGGRTAFTVPGDVPVLALDGHRGDWPDCGGPAARLMYLIYTSGSTGEPKGVAVTHADVLDLARADARLRVAPGETVAQLAPVAFDASVFEIWVALCSGATVEVMPQGPVSVAALGEFLRDRRPDWLFLTTGLFHAMVDHDLEGLAHAARVLTGGDVLSPQHVRAAAARTRLYAAYGPTETTVFASLHTIEQDIEEQTVPLGTPLLKKTMEVLGPDLRRRPDGEPGEICLSGAGLARGYDGAPGRTALRFVPDPRGTGGSRLYRSGDIGSRRADGVVDFRGRADRQVKIRGFRIELGEIEAVLNRHPAVAAGTALALDAPGGKRLVGYVAPVPGETLTPGAVRSWLGDRLPPHMVPRIISVLDRMPLDRNGKFDRSALRDPWASRAALDVGDIVAPRDEREARLAELFADVLGMDQVGVTDDFFLIGGDSLRTVDLLATMAESGFAVVARDFFRDPSVVGIAARLTTRVAESAAPTGLAG